MTPAPPSFENTEKKEEVFSIAQPPEKNSARRRRPKYARWGLLIVSIAAALALWGIAQRWSHEAQLREQTEDQAMTVVSVVTPELNKKLEEYMFPATMRAHIETPIRARVSGYIKRWSADIGAHVKKGQLLAEIEAPELDAQLRQAKAELSTTQAQEKLARTTAERWIALFKTNSVSRQETDEKVSAAAASLTQVQAAQANVARLQEMYQFKDVIAPFEGVVTMRRIDVGSLINATDATAELFQLADASHLRIQLEIPESIAPYMENGLEASIRAPSRTGQIYKARISRTADALNPSSRTLLVELDMDNSQTDLLPGAYAEVTLKLPLRANKLLLPVNALVFRSAGMQVAKVTAHSEGEGIVALLKVTLGRDFGSHAEVISGVSPDDRIILNPPDSLSNNQIVRILSPREAKQAGEKGGDK